jgi:hypothetical protein
MLGEGSTWLRSAGRAACTHRDGRCRSPGPGPIYGLVYVFVVEALTSFASIESSWMKRISRELGFFLYVARIKLDTVLFCEGGQ